MFNSRKGNYSQYLANTTLPIIKDTCNGVPEITSTPLNSHGQLSRRSSVLLSPTKSKLITPRRYSLSEINSPSLRMREAYSPGPLLASLSFKDNVSMYEETKSSGLARRIVLYNEEVEQEGRQPTHQEKYHCPGLFPIVHLFKKKPPPLEQSPKRVKIKLSIPDYLINQFPQKRSKPLEGLARPRLQNKHRLSSCSEKSNDTDTKSVLDALKEISRKRIHSHEECDLNEDTGKRIRTELLHNGTPSTSKRNRADSPFLDSSESPPPKQSQKKFCVYDEFAASKSSTDFSFLNKMEPARSKRKTISTSTESLKETKHVKLINAETQTILPSTESKTKSVQFDESDSLKTKKKESPLKIFDDAPLDRIRKNRLAALMGNLAGKDAVILPKPCTGDSFSSEHEEFKEKEESIDKFNEYGSVLVPSSSMAIKKNLNETDVANKPLISILSPSKTTKELSPVRSDKHVHFTVPGTSSSLTFNQTLLTQTSASIVTPIISASISNFSSSNNAEENAGFPCTVSSVNLKSKSSTTSSDISNSFKNLGSKKSDTIIDSALSTSSNSSFSCPKPLQPLMEDSFTVPNLTFEKPKMSSPKKLGGFKFELKSSSTADLKTTTTDKSGTPTITFSNSYVSNTIGSALLTGTSSTFTFPKPTEPKKDSTFNFVAASTVNSDTTSDPTFSFGGGTSKSQTFEHIKTGTKLPLINSTTATGFSFGSADNPPMFGTATTLVTGSSMFTTSTSRNYGSQNIDSGSIRPNFSFTRNTPITTISAMFAFGGASAVTSSSGIGNSPTPSFGINSSSTTSSSMFGNSGATVVSGFGNVPSTTTSVFGGVTTTSTPGFGSIPNISKSVFGTTPVTSTAIFGHTPASTTAFGNNDHTSAGSGFGIGVPTTTSSGFGTNNSTFDSNLTTTTPIFGSSSTKTNAFGSSGFEAAYTQAPTFGNNTTPSFGNSTQLKAGFGSLTATPNPSAFGSNTFGSTTTGTSTITSAPAFGTSSSTSTFGSNKPTTNVFGSVTTTSTNTFGSNMFLSNTGFDQSSGFSNNNIPTFGNSTTSANTFGATNPPAFAHVENKPVFAFGDSGENKNNPVFGSGNSAFGKPTNTQGGFGSTAGGFGTTSSSGFSSQTNGGFNFGSNATSSPAPFPFGASNGSAEPTKPTFNFTGGASNPPAFGSTSSAPSFGSSNHNFGAPSFGAPGSQAAGVFNIGAGSNTGRPRTQLRAKRRT